MWFKLFLFVILENNSTACYIDEHSLKQTSIRLFKISCSSVIRFQTSNILYMYNFTICIIENDCTILHNVEQLCVA